MRYTDDQLKHTIDTLNIMKAEHPGVDDATYTVDYIVDVMIDYFRREVFDNAYYRKASASSDYERAMKAVAP